MFKRFTFLKNTPVILAVLAFCLASCEKTPKDLERFESLSNQGILGLSSTNAYLGTNLFLAEQAEKSNSLFNFFQNKGAPSAIELKTDRGPEAKLYMYYPVDKELYVSDYRVTEEYSEWITRGPFAIPRKDFRPVVRLEQEMQGVPVFIINGREYRFKEKVKFVPETILKPSIVLPPPKPKSTPIMKKKPKAPVIVVAPTATPFIPMNDDQRAIAEAQKAGKLNTASPAAEH